MRLWPSFASRSPAPPDAFGFAVVGLGHGAHKFLEALRSSPLVRVAALVSGDAAKARRLASRYSVPTTYSYADFDRIAGNPAVQAVYLCLPNALHREFTERAARAGKHVLCEKPMAPTVADCEAMIAACAQANRLLMIGYRSEFSSGHHRAREVVASGTLGKVQTIRSGFGFSAKGGWRLRPALAGGGSLLDVGIYPIHLVHSLFGELTLTSATLQRDAVTGLEMDAAWQGRIASGASVHCRSSYRETIHDFFEIEGERATLTLRPAFAYAGVALQVSARHAGDRAACSLRLATPLDEPSAFRLEAEHLASCALHGEPLRTPGEIGLRDMQTINAIEALAPTLHPRP